jgi:hypothetical protein
MFTTTSPTAVTSPSTPPRSASNQGWDRDDALEYDEARGDSDHGLAVICTVLACVATVAFATAAILVR